jgi:hypothetical protein
VSKTIYSKGSYNGGGEDFYNINNKHTKSGRIRKIRLLSHELSIGQCPLDPEHRSLAGPLGTSHVSLHSA